MRNRGFGDVIWTEPVVRYFLAQGEEVLLFTKHETIFRNYPSDRLYINKPEMALPLSELPIILQFGEHPHMHYLQAFGLQACIPDLPLTYPQLHLSPREKKRKIEKRYAVLHLDFYPDRSNYRNVYGVDWKQVVDHLRQKGLEVIQISKKGKELFAPWFPTRNFRQVMSLIYHSDLFIGLDSGPSHIAAAMNIPAVIFFGSVNPKYRHLDSRNKVFLQSPCPFAHCYHERLGVFGQPCRLVPAKPPCCIQDASRVINAIGSLL